MSRIRVVLQTVLSLSSALAECDLVYATTIFNQEKEVGDAVWQRYVPDALVSGQLQPKPDPIVIKGGLAKIQDGLDRQKKGVSAGKVVVLH